MMDPGSRGAKLSRRAVLAGTAGAIAVAKGVPAHAGTPPKSFLVDVHSHWLPTAYLEAMHRAGVHDVDGYPIPAWSEAAHLAVMEKAGIAASILSMSAPGLEFLQKGDARSLARRINEHAAAQRDRTGGRLGAFALLTLPDVDGSLEEMRYALDTLKLDGIGLYTNIGGTYLGDEKFDPIFAEADRRRATVFVHPIAPPGFAALSLGFPAPAIEYPFDTTRMLLNMAAKATLKRYPNMKLIAAHGGGTLPYLANRISTLVPLLGKRSDKASADQVLAELRTVYYDMTAIANPMALASYTQMVPASRRLFGSDFPFMREVTIGPAISALRQESGAGDIVAQSSANALALFPRLTNMMERHR